MNEEDRETLIKEVRINALHDMTMVLAKLLDSGPDEDTHRAAKLLLHYVGLRHGEVASGTADRINVTHRVWEDS